MRPRGITASLFALLALLALSAVARAEEDGISPADHRLRRFQKKSPRPMERPLLAGAAAAATEIQSNRDRREVEPAAEAHPTGSDHPTRQRENVERSGSESTVAKIGAKLGRGIVNILTGWIEFPVQIVKRSKSDGIGAGLSLGLLEGVGMTVVRTLAGAVEVVTFLAPLPGDYDPLLEPPIIFH